jgi:hypothetical protein
MPENFSSEFSSHFFHSESWNSIFGPQRRGMTTYDQEQQHFNDYFMALDLVDVANLERQISENMLVYLYSLELML